MDNRKFTRSAISITATLLPENGAGLSGEVSNVSLYGLFLETTEANTLEPKQPLGLSIQLSGDNSELRINCQAVIVRVDDVGVGVHIEGLSVDSFLHWKNIVAYASGNVERVEKEFSDYVCGNLSMA